MKKFIIPALLTSFMLVGCNVQPADAPKPEFDAKETTDAEDLLFENAKLINDFDVTDLNKPSIGIQRANEGTDHLAIRFIAAIKVVDMDDDGDVDEDDLHDTSAVWYRDLFLPDGTNRGTSVLGLEGKPSAKAYTAFNNGGDAYTIEEFNADHNNSTYTHFVTYVLKGIDQADWERTPMTVYLKLNDSTYSDCAITTIDGEFNYSCAYDEYGFFESKYSNDTRTDIEPIDNNRENGVDFDKVWTTTGNSFSFMYRGENSCVVFTKSDIHFWNGNADYFVNTDNPYYLKYNASTSRNVYASYSWLNKPHKGSLNLYAPDSQSYARDGDWDSFGNSFYLGIYPQTRITNASLIGNLNALGNNDLTPYGWYSYNGNYYAKVVATPSGSYQIFQDNTTIVEGDTYWFICEPIEWIVASKPEDNSLSLGISRYVLDVTQYATNTGSGSNNYENSNLRSFLNEDFLNSAFIYNWKGFGFSTYWALNGTATTNSSSNPYTCGSTQDRVTPLSYQNVITNDDEFSSFTRYATATDYARAKGAKLVLTESRYDAPYWTRSPDGSDESKASYAVNKQNVGVADVTENYGVRPFIEI